MKRLLKELCSTKLHNWSFHRTFYLNKIVLQRSYKLLPACVLYSPGSSFISGYSLSSGKFLSARSSHLYVAGSPRNDDSRGKVSNLKKTCRCSERIHLNNVCANSFICYLHYHYMLLTLPLYVTYTTIICYLHYHYPLYFCI